MTANIYSYTVIRSSTEAFTSKLPYVVAVLENETGTRFTAFIEGYQDGMDIEIGRTVKFLNEDMAGRKIYTF